MKISNINNSCRARLHMASLAGSLLAAVAATAGLTACSDDWNDHYDAKSAVVSDQTLWQQIQSQPNLSDFARVLQATKTFRSHKKTSVSYADLLASDQIYTVWAPLNGTFNADSLVEACATPQGDSAVERRFVKIHIARYNHPISSTMNERINMLNQKHLPVTSETFSGISYASKNTLMKNGILHTIEHALAYPYNIYEYLCTFDEVSHVGGFFLYYQKDSLDRQHSVVEGVKDGLTVYVDSVMIETNPMVREMGFIDREDSTYWIAVPSNGGWDKAYQEAKTYYNFSFIERSDSLQKLWAQRALINDAIFNFNAQNSPTDSLISTKYSKWNPKYHVFYKPYDAGGVLSTYTKKAFCSNGCIFESEQWPFSKYDTYFIPVKVEGEAENHITDMSLCTLNARYAAGDSVSGHRYLDVVPATNSANPTLTFEIPNTLSGKYDVCVVCLPRTVYDVNSDDVRPYQFKATLSYAGENGESKTFNCSGKAFNNNPLVVDTVCVAEAFQFPTCNYSQDKVTVSLKLTVSITSKQTKLYNREMYIDCIYLRPVKDTVSTDNQ